MDDSFNLARHAARLVSLLLRQPEAIDQQKLELRTLVLMTKEGTVRLSTRDGQLVANGLLVPTALAGVRDLADQMVGHGVDSVEVNQGVSPGEMLSLARILAAPIDADRTPIHDRLRALGVTSIVVSLRDPVAEAAATVEHVVAEPPPGSAERIPFILSRANRGGDGHPLIPHFDEVAFAVEQATREGRTDSAMTGFGHLLVHEAEATDPEARRHYVLTVRRLTKPWLLQPIARVFVDDPGRRDEALAILARCRTDGVDAVVDQLGRAATGEQRKTFLGILDQLPATDEAIVAMLADVRPHMMRLAAEQIARRRPPDGDRALADQLTNADARVRRAAVRALGAYDTQFSVDAVARVLDDPVVEVRLEAVAALAGRRGGKVGEIIGRAMDAEGDIEVHAGMLAALGKIGTAEAVAKLAKAAEPNSGLFASRKGASLRVAAVRALATARTPGALSALKHLTNDKEREVRDAASHALGH
jgi:hypothetical protein